MNFVPVPGKASATRRLVTTINVTEHDCLRAVSPITYFADRNFIKPTEI